MAKGVKTGGRIKGTPNRATAAREAEIAESGKTPLEFMLDTMRDPGKEFDVRLDAAKSAAPYVHPKLAAIEHTGKDGGAIETKDMTDQDLRREVLFMLAQEMNQRKDTV